MAIRAHIHVAFNSFGRKEREPVNYKQKFSAKWAFVEVVNYYVCKIMNITIIILFWQTARDLSAGWPTQEWDCSAFVQAKNVRVSQQHRWPGDTSSASLVTSRNTQKTHNFSLSLENSQLVCHYHPLQSSAECPPPQLLSIWKWAKHWMALTGRKFAGMAAQREIKSTRTQ